MVGILVYVIDIQLDANFYMISKFVDKKRPGVRTLSWT